MNHGVLFYSLQIDLKMLQLFQETKEYEGTFLEELLFYVTELEKRKLTSHGGSGSASDANSNAYHSFDKPLDEVARDGVQKLSLEEMVFVLAGLDDLLECTKTSKGKLEVFKAGAIPEAIRLAKQETGKYIDDVVRAIFSHYFKLLHGNRFH